MKMTKEHYARLRSAVAPFMPLDATERQRWGALWQAIDGGRIGYPHQEFGDYLNDDHIDTALRKVSREVWRYGMNDRDITKLRRLVQREGVSAGDRQTVEEIAQELEGRNPIRCNCGCGARKPNDGRVT